MTAARLPYGVKRVIPRGDYVRAIHAAEAYIGRHYEVVGFDGVPYSAHPGDYWAAADGEPLGAIVKLRHSYTTNTGRLVVGRRLLTMRGTVGDLRRLARAALMDVEIR
jgi:hypothetical protein